MIESPLLIEKKCETIKEAVLALAEQAELALRRSLAALRAHDLQLAREIVEADEPINRQRRVLEQEALVALSAYQPAGHHLRLIGASMEMCPELERIADYAADVARILLRGETLDFPPVMVERVAEMAEAAVSMLGDAMAAYRHEGGDAQMARAVAARDDLVDALQREALDAVLELVREEPEAVATGVALCRIVHLYERAADRATNLAEAVVYIATAESADLDRA